MRGSPVHFVLVALPYTVAGVLMLYTSDALIAAFLLGSSAAVQHVLHSSVRLPFSKYLELVFITPRLHFVHHHPNPRFTNSNYGFIFSIWDRAFGTYTEPDSIPENEKGQLGLDYEISMLRLFFGLPRVHAAPDVPKRKAA